MYRGCRVYEYFTYFVARFRGVVCIEFILVLGRLVFVMRRASE